MKPQHMEIERKFLIAELPRGLARYPHKEIAQGYLSIGRNKSHVRLRRAGRACALTYKRGPARAREEREIHPDAGSSSRSSGPPPSALA